MESPPYPYRTKPAFNASVLVNCLKCCLDPPATPVVALCTADMVVSVSGASADGGVGFPLPYPSLYSSGGTTPAGPLCSEPLQSRSRRSTLSPEPPDAKTRWEVVPSLFPRTPQALHSVALPSGPLRHIGVEPVPQSRHLLTSTSAAVAVEPQERWKKDRLVRPTPPAPAVGVGLWLGLG